MTKRALLASFFGMVLVLGLTTSSFAAWYQTSNPADPNYAALPGSPFSSGVTWSSIDISVPVPDSSVPGSTSPYLKLTFNFLAEGAWNAAAGDNLTFTLLKDGAAIDTIVFNSITRSAGGAGTSMSLTNYYDYGSGIYNLVAMATTVGAGTWELTSASLSSTSNTPLPAAVWLLGSGLVGFMGYRSRTRKNVAA